MLVVIDEVGANWGSKEGWDGDEETFIFCSDS